MRGFSRMPGTTSGIKVVFGRWTSATEVCDQCTQVVMQFPVLDLVNVLYQQHLDLANGVLDAAISLAGIYFSFVLMPAMDAVLGTDLHPKTLVCKVASGSEPCQTCISSDGYYVCRQSVRPHLRTCAIEHCCGLGLDCIAECWPSVQMLCMGITCIHLHA